MKQGKYTITPFIETSLCEEATALYKEHKLEVTGVKFHRTANGFLCVRVDWDKSTVDCKFASKGMVGFEYNACTLELEFNPTYQIKDLDFDIKLGIRVGLQLVDKNGDATEEYIKYEPLFFQNLGRGAAVYFGPKGWDRVKTTFVEKEESLG